MALAIDTEESFARQAKSVRTALKLMEYHWDVVVVRSRGGEAHRRLACGGLACLCALACSLLSHDGWRGSAAAAARPAELLRTELRLRSANLVIKDLAGEWDGRSFTSETNLHEPQGASPFDFCGRAHMTQRQVKVCADYFLSSMRDKLGDNSKGEGKTGAVLYGFPKLSAFDKCMMAPTNYMIKACIRGKLLSSHVGLFRLCPSGLCPSGLCQSVCLSGMSVGQSVSQFCLSCLSVRYDACEEGRRGGCSIIEHGRIICVKKHRIFFLQFPNNAGLLPANDELFWKTPTQVWSLLLFYLVMASCGPMCFVYAYTHIHTRTSY